MKEIFFKSNYVVNKSNDPIVLSITIGQAQRGSSDVEVNGQEICSGKSIKDFKVGTGAELINKKIQVMSVVTDISTNTNKLVVIYKLTGGKVDFTHTLETTVEEERDSAYFELTLNVTS